MEGAGQYGVEGYLNDQLNGTPGRLAAKTDNRGVPIATAENVLKPAVRGLSYALTIDRNIQAMAEQELAAQVAKVKAKSGSIVIMDPANGAIRAIANYPTYDPANYGAVSDYSVFQNQAVSSQFEPGSGMKAFTMAAGLDQGKVRPDSTFDDPKCVRVGDRNICNAEVDKPGKNKTMTMVLRDSLNTGVMYVLRMLGGDPDKITLGGKKTLYNYLTTHFGFGSRTGIEQAGEAAGYLPGPSTNDVTYASISFGQGMSATMVQMVAAMAAVANGGTLYQPQLVDGVVKPDGTVDKRAPKVGAAHVMGATAISDLTSMLSVVVEHGSGYKARIKGYEGQIAGKTGTAQIAKPNGSGYIEGANIGSFVGFAPVSKPRFVLMVRINEPQIDGYAEVTTVPVFRDVCEWLFKYYGIAPSS
jgi:cell division protein FtsI/penicillin-binding protein 2